MPTIERITATPYNIPLKGSLKWGKAQELKHLEHVLIRVDLSDGAVGYAEATPRPTIYGETQASVLHIVRRYLADIWIGQAINTPDTIAKLSQGMELIKGNNTAKGALDMAVHHALSQSHGKTLGDYLQTLHTKIEVSYIVSTGKLDAVIADVDMAYQAGVRVFKVKIGKDIPQEIQTLEQLTAHYPDARFYVDANQTLTIDSASTVLKELYEMDVIHCEEPLPVHHLRDRQNLHQQTLMPIIADDSAFTIADLEMQIAHDTLDILNIKTPRTGFSQSTKMLKLCRQHVKQVMVGSQASSLLGCLFAATFAGMAFIDCANEVSFFLKTDTDISNAPPIVDGYMQMEDVQTAIERIMQRIDIS